MSRFIGGTAAAALAGVNPPGWAQPIDVYNEMLDLGPERKQSRMMAMGHLMEQVVADLFTEATGLALRKPAARADRTCSYLHPEGGCTATLSQQYPWAGAHLDRWVSEGTTFEAKWAERRDEWGPSLPVGTVEAPVIIPGPDDPEYRPQVPARYMVQVQHGLAVTGRPLGYLAVLLGYGDFRWYALWRDQAMINTLMDIEERFWQDNYLAGVPPEPDGSPGYTRHLRRTLEHDDGSEAVATPEQQAMAATLHACLQTEANMARTTEQVRQRLMRSMGSAARLVGPDFTISYREGKPRLKVEWEALATRLLEQAYPAAEPTGIFLPEQWPKTKKARAELIRDIARRLELAHDEPGTRPFVPTFDSDEESTDAST